MKRLFTLLLFSILSSPLAWAADPLPSWNDGKAKRGIMAFVQQVTDSNSPNYIEPEERVAAFGNNGTLWVEKPLPTQTTFGLDMLREVAVRDPGIRRTQPYKAAFENDMGYFRGLPEEQFLQIMIQVHTGYSQTEFERRATNFLAKASHPRFQVPYTQAVYLPMLELMQYLRGHGFKIFIVTRGTVEFVRIFSQDVYGVPRENIVGSGLQYQFQMQGQVPTLQRIPQAVQPVNNGAGKPVNIQRHIGRRPVIVVGNSDGDLQMLQFAQSKDRPSLQIVLRHDDAEREYAYDAGAEQLLSAARTNRWQIVSMKKDFRRVFLFQVH